jgi:hypothetical protein
MHERVTRLQEELRDRAKILAASAAALNPLAKPDAYADLTKLEPLVAKARKKIEGAATPPKAVVALLDSVGEWRTERQKSLRDRLGRELGAACASRGWTMRVVSREDPIELRIAGLSLVVDSRRGRAEIRFARETIAAVAAESAAIVKGIETVRARLDGAFDPAEFFDRCRAAWSACRVVMGAPERVEILDFLSYLAVGMQKQKFRYDPIKANYADYSRAQFAYDLWRLRRAGALVRGGFRLNLGVATGTTASQKKRVVYVEDEDGNGEYKLTVFFTKEDPTA